MKNGKIILTKLKYVKKEDIIGGCIFFAIFPFGLLLRIILKIQRRKIWVISENGNCMTACDNAYNFFEYLIALGVKDIFFVINKRSPYYEKVLKHGSNIVVRGTLKHWLLYLSADSLISTHSLSAPSMGIFYLIQKLGLARRNLVFLQHGITQNNLEPLYYENCNIRLFLCGAKREYEYIRDNFHYPEGYVKYTGFARFDALHENKTVKKQILIIPTWRRWIAMDLEKDDDFVKTQYYLEFQYIINNEKFISFLERNNISVLFYVHQLMNRFLKYFSACTPNIIIASDREYDIQQLLQQSAALVTDYSSVFFDFAYMGKPVVYFQFDLDEFRDKHYKKGYFDYKKDGFGPVINNAEEVIDELIMLYKNNFVMEEKYTLRLKDFFELNDANNCDRIYDAIRTII